MTAPAVDPAELRRRTRTLTLVFCTVLAIIGVLLFVGVTPHGRVSVGGLALGAALGGAGFLLARWLPARGLRPLGPGEHDDGAASRVVTAGFLAIALSEAPALVAFGFAEATGDRGAYLLAGPLAIASVILNATGTPALRRHVARLESRGGSTDLVV